MASVDIRGVTKSFGTHPVIHGVDIAIADHEFVVLVGPSGCGKTTLLRCIGGLERVTSGRIVIGARDVTTLQPSARDVAMVFQNYALYPHMTVRKNLGYGLRVRKTPRKEIARRVAEAAKLLELEELLDRRPGQLSGGQQQRVAIARALSMDPIAMLFDEPTSALDPEMINEVLDVMVELAREGMTMMVVTHEMGFARKVAHRVIFMDGGRIVEDAKKEEFFGTPRSERAQLFLSKILHH